MSFNKNQCMDIIYRLANESGMKINALERTAGLSRGYLSKMNNPDNDTCPTIDKLDAIAQALGTPLETLLTESLDEADKNVAYLNSRILRLCKMTTEHKLIWKREQRSLFVGMPKQSQHPLAQVNPNGKLCFKSAWVYKDDQYDVSLLGGCYVAQLDQHTKFYFARVQYGCFECKPAFELYAEIDGDMHGIAHAIEGVNEDFKHMLQRLDNAIYNSLHPLRIKTQIRKVLDTLD